ncbi:short-chain collagen C4 [Exaiptasia diaphana]|uniref:Short-chain collagen C4-like n=1 Tax=Exaiptasia diaphana TaxID=2652724 RepID=A0A913Y1S4_EXADI|nr:short-chain collagen C4 [Exaiptasia diaphana]KXJ29244.1 Short-chain collagen C4 [Exaiptasia diaphana]
MLFKAIFIVVVLAMFWGVDGADDEHNGVVKRGTLNKTNQNLQALSDVVKALNERIKVLESRSLQGCCKDGAPGKPGKDGKDGTPGKDGVGLPGRDGKNGLPGRDGKNGLPGKEGKNGFPGKDGASGKNGVGLPGLRGSPGRQGPRGAQGLRGHPGPKSGGVQYIRWGKTTCPSGAKLIYKGRVGGEHYGHRGGGSNYVCLTESPKYWSYTNVLKKYSAFMYGAEYQVHSTNHPNPFHNKNLHNHDVPCAVCFVSNRNTKLMIPATYECPAGWSKEYWGYLVSECYNHANQKNFICVDQDAEPVKGSYRSRAGAYLFGVKGRCGSLPCLPYVEGRELTCAVCTK